MSIINNLQAGYAYRMEPNYLGRRQEYIKRFGNISNSLQEAIFRHVDKQIKNEEPDVVTLFNASNFGSTTLLTKIFNDADLGGERTYRAANVLYIRNGWLKSPLATYFSFLRPLGTFLSYSDNVLLRDACRKLDSIYSKQFINQTYSPYKIAGKTLRSAKILKEFTFKCLKGARRDIASMASLLDAGNSVRLVADKHQLCYARQLVNIAFMLLPDHGIGFNYDENIHDNSAYLRVKIINGKRMIKGYAEIDLTSEDKSRYVDGFYLNLLDALKDPAICYGNNVSHKRIEMLEYVHHLIKTYKNKSKVLKKINELQEAQKQYLSVSGA